MRRGLPKRSKASRSAATGASRSRSRKTLERKRPVVLFCSRAMLAGVIVLPPSSSVAGSGVCQQARVRPARPLLGARIPQQALVLVKRQIDAEHVERELVDVEVATEVPLFHADARGAGQRLEELALLLRHVGADGALPIVQLRSRGHEDAATRLAFDPFAPALQERIQARQSARLRERGL